MIVKQTERYILHVLSHHSSFVDAADVVTVSELLIGAIITLRCIFLM